MRVKRFVQVMAIVATVFASWGCASIPQQTPEVETATFIDEPVASDTVQTVVFTAVQLIGVPYRWGGTTPDEGMDCSGLVQYVYRNAGLQVPRTSREQYHAVRRIHPENLQPGDLVFFRLNSRRVSHVGIYLGDGRFIHSPRTGKHVSYASLENQFWRERFAGAGTFF